MPAQLGKPLVAHRSNWDYTGKEEQKGNLTEQSANPYFDRFIAMHHFFVRKVLLVKYSRAFMVMPGGLGTLDEALEALTLVWLRSLDTWVSASGWV